MANRLHNKVAIVTGSTLGIGAAVAHLFAAEGACVVFNSHRDDDAAATMRRQLGDEKALFVQGDVADPASMVNLVAQTTARFGKLDIVINNAGMDVFSDPLALAAEQWQRCMAVDLEGAWNLARAALPAMLAQGAGSIVNIASVHGHRIIPGCFPYPVAKHALIGLTKSLAIEYAARGIRVNSISPGLILTERVESWLASTPGERERQTAILPCKRIGQPEEVAYTALFLASDEARFINAADIVIDGGRTQLYHE
ncbi:MAG: SDR family oxidoreductase [Burkholderiaceae bacterium]|nr:SDR family oxidoreductase [Burkholderiaceae bacterium]